MTDKAARQARKRQRQITKARKPSRRQRAWRQWCSLLQQAGLGTEIEITEINAPDYPTSALWAREHQRSGTLTMSDGQVHEVVFDFTYCRPLPQQTAAT